MTIKVVTDSTCDLPPALIDKHSITVVPCYINAAVPDLHRNHERVHPLAAEAEKAVRAQLNQT